MLVYLLNSMKGSEIMKRATTSKNGMFWASLLLNGIFIITTAIFLITVFTG